MVRQTAAGRSYYGAGSLGFELTTLVISIYLPVDLLVESLTPQLVN
jgi:hypothetical protein